MLEKPMGDLVTLTDKLFTQFQQLIQETSGICLSDSKRTMLSMRLAKRLRELELSSFEEYYSYIDVETNFSKELQPLLNVVTTNKTDFYREKHHFEYLVNSIVPSLWKEHQIGNKCPLKIWSAGCSSGEEPYTIAMELAEIMGVQTECFKILATDISTKVLQEAIDAVYSEACIEPIPKRMQKKYLLRGKGNLEHLYKVSPEIRKHVTFGRLNFINENYKISDRMHVIFCRNALIYFDEKTKHTILEKLCQQLEPNGYLFIGHSETLYPPDFQLRKIYPTLYQRINKKRATR